MLVPTRWLRDGVTMDKLTRRLTELTFRPKDRAATDATVTLSIPKVDLSWRGDTGFYLPPGAETNHIGHRYEDMVALVAKNGSMDQPEICLNDSGEIVFIDGRHRFAAMRDIGHLTFKASVPPNQADAFTQRFA
jgi:hypothetical protein